VAKVEVNKFYLPGVTIQIEPKRNYPYRQTLAHVLGYVSEISSEEIKSKEYKGYAPGDYIGKFGLERAYEKYLRGIDGEKRVEVDASGKEVRVLDTKEPVSGMSLHLHIDADMQAAADKALEGKKAGVVATDVRSGGVLVLLSKPGFDPNNLSSGVSKDYWKDIATSKAHPLQNRALQGRFPPGSTFKIALALAGLEKGVINDRTTFTCRGGFQFGNHFFRCWKKEGHGTISLHRAIVSSCDVYFYNLGLKLGVDNIHEMGAAIGLTKPTGIDLPGEKVGLIPSSAWKLKTYGEKWYEGETVSVSIGQGAVWLTPLGLMQLAAFAANGGVTFKPQIVNRIVSPEGKVVKVFEPAMLTDVKLRKDTFAQVREGMKGVVNEQGGTAYGSRLQNISMSGKTGTAQSVGMEKGVGKGDHAWFVAYAPSDDPAIAMAVLVEHGGHGATTAAPVAKALTDVFQKQRTETKAAQLDTHR
jgi:penicillin-binding protein 2